MRAGLRIVVAGMIAGDPHQGGATWAVLQYVIGLRRLGHDVVLVEPVDELSPATTAYFDDVVRTFGLGGRAALVERGSRRTTGIAYDELAREAHRTDLLLNVAGMLDDPALVGPPRTRVWLDLDPAFNQLWHAVDGIDMGFDRHERFVTVGLAIGAPHCTVPACGRRWITTPQPVVLAHWPPAPPSPAAPLTTVANFRGYGSIDWNGTLYGQKAHSLRRLVELPRRVRRPLAIALAIHPDERTDLAALRDHGWGLVDPLAAAGTPGAYARFIRASGGELGVAKSGYVESRCGWFSDRSACYLASGRPVVAQETGWSSHLPEGDGLLAFDDVAGAAAAIERIEADPTGHSRAARALAERVFDSDRVLPPLLEALR